MFELSYLRGQEEKFSILSQLPDIKTQIPTDRDQHKTTLLPKVLRPSIENFSLTAKKKNSTICIENSH